MSTVPPAAPSVQLRVQTDEDALSWHRAFDDPEVMEFFGGTPAELSLYMERAEIFTTERSEQVVQCFRPALNA